MAAPAVGRPRGVGFGVAAQPYFMAGWVGMLITGLNMLPVSQLDGGHTIYALFGRDAYKMARAFTIVAIVYVVLNLEQAAIWTPMLILVISWASTTRRRPTTASSWTTSAGSWAWPRWRSRCCASR